MEPYAVPRFSRMALAAASPETPVESGTIDVRASVSLTVETAP